MGALLVPRRNLCAVDQYGLLIWADHLIEWSRGKAATNLPPVWHLHDVATAHNTGALVGIAPSVAGVHRDACVIPAGVRIAEGRQCPFKLWPLKTQGRNILERSCSALGFRQLQDAREELSRSGALPVFLCASILPDLALVGDVLLPELLLTRDALDGGPSP